MFKNINKIILLFLLVVGWTSCKDKLDEVIYSQLTDQNAFNTKSDAEAVINGLYSEFKNVGFRQLFFAYDLPSDVTYKENLPLEILKSNDINQDTDVRDMWNQFYIMVSRCNVAIDNISEMDPAIFLDDGEIDVEVGIEFKEQLLGQAQFIRGWAYMNLTNCFYEIPYNTNGQLPPATELSLSTIDVIENGIIKDFEDAAKVLPESYGSIKESGRPTFAAAQGMLAKIYMSRAGRLRRAGADATNDWTAALNCITEIEETGLYGLQPTVLDVFALDDSQVPTLGLATGLMLDPAKLYNNELIWAIHSSGSNESGSTNTGLVFTDWNFDMGWNLLNVPLEFAWKFDPADQRLTTLMATEYPNIYNTGVDWDAFYKYPETINEVGTLYKEIQNDNGLWEIHNELTAVYTLKYKFQKTWEYNYNTSNNVILLRYADIVLMKAEILNELNQPGDAIALVNTIRERAFGNAMHNLNYADQEKVREAICDERAFELNNEGNRRADLIRMGLWSKFMGQYIESIKEKYIIKEENAERIADENNPDNAPHDFDYSSNYLIYPLSSELTEDDKRRYFPVPKSETDVNQKLLGNLDNL